MTLKKHMDRQRVSAEACGELHDKSVAITRTAKVVKGGRRFGFSALVVSGDGRGHAGFGLGKANEVPDAIRKASERAHKNLIQVPLKGSTIPYDVIGKFGPATVILKPAAPGTGVIAGSVVRAILDAVGIRDIRTKCIGSTNQYNVVYALFSAFLQLRDPAFRAAARGINLEELGYQPF